MNVNDRATAYINIRPRTRQQLIRYLKGKDYSEEEIEETVRELEEYHYIDDLKYSIMYFEYGFEKGRGISRIKRELQEKGVASDVIDMAYDELGHVPDQFEQALEIGRQMILSVDIEQLDYSEKNKLKAKIGRRLMSRGFSSDIVYKVINRLV